MRYSSFLVVLLSSLTLSGCSYDSAPENLAAGVTSRETTSSIAPSSGPIPANDIGTIIASAGAPQPVSAWTEPAAPVPAFAPEPAIVPVPVDKQVAILMPQATRAASELRGTLGRVYGQRFRDAKPINFGARSPANFAVHGIDVSRWQGEMDWAKLRTQGANFVFIKATDGGDHLDPMFRKNWRKAAEAGIKRGAYHFFYWCRTAGEQADWFIRNVPKEKGALPPVIDVEWNGESRCKKRPSRARVLEKMQVFMDKLERHYGQRPIIYTAPDFYADNLKGAFPDYPFWLRSVAAYPEKRYPGRKWVFWQYSGSGLSHGVTGRIDLNVFNGTEDQWHRWVAARSH